MKIQRKIDDLAFNIHKNEMNINELLMESKSLRNQINYLEKEVSHLLEFEFEEKLRKLLKNLLEY